MHGVRVRVRVSVRGKGRQDEHCARDNTWRVKRQGTRARELTELSFYARRVPRDQNRATGNVER